MFTGIVQEMGTVRGRMQAGDAIRFVVEAPAIAPRLSVGGSVSCDGACLTVERLLDEPADEDAVGKSAMEAPRKPAGFSVCAVPETLARTTLSLWAVGGRVNLEAALTAADSLGGHFVLGHVDGVCEVTAMKDLGDGGREMTVRLPEEFLPCCVRKGSITLAGVSLTIAALDGDSLRVALIPHTLAVTTLGFAAPGGRLNFEIDILAKHVARLAGAPDFSPLQDRAPITGIARRDHAVP